MAPSSLRSPSSRSAAPRRALPRTAARPSFPGAPTRPGGTASRSEAHPRELARSGGTTARTGLEKGGSVLWAVGRSRHPAGAWWGSCVAQSSDGAGSLQGRARDARPSACSPTQNHTSLSSIHFIATQARARRECGGRASAAELRAPPSPTARRSTARAPAAAADGGSSRALARRASAPPPRRSARESRSRRPTKTVRGSPLTSVAVVLFRRRAREALRSCRASTSGDESSTTHTRSPLPSAAAALSQTANKRRITSALRLVPCSLRTCALSLISSKLPSCCV